VSDGVTVAQGPLEAFVMVRIHVGQPISPLLNMETVNVRQLPHAFGKVMNLIDEGQQVEIVKKGKF
jgi:hypothetical protein